MMLHPTYSINSSLSVSFIIAEFGRAGNAFSKKGKGQEFMIDKRENIVYDIGG